MKYLVNKFLVYLHSSFKPQSFPLAEHGERWKNKIVGCLCINFVWSLLDIILWQIILLKNDCFFSESRVGIQSWDAPHSSRLCSSLRDWPISWEFPDHSIPFLITGYSWCSLVQHRSVCGLHVVPSRKLAIRLQQRSTAVTRCLETL